MKAISANVTRGLEVGSRVKVADNSGADVVEIISVKKYHGVKKRIPSCGVGSLVMIAVKKGNEKMKHEVAPAVIIRQRKEYRRKNGMRIAFESNAAVIVSEKGETKGTRIKGPVAKEAIERFSLIGKISTIVV